MPHAPSPSPADRRAAPRIGRVFWALALLLSAWALAVVLASPDLVQGARMVIRLTARTSLALFLLAFTASTWVRLVPGPGTAWLLAHRRPFGLGFAFSHALHLVAIVAFARLDPAGFAQQTGVANIVTGGIAYLFIALMAATSWNGAVRWLGARRWQWLHTIGAHYLWLSFVLSFGKRIPMSAAYAVPVLLLLAAMGLRLAGRLQARGRRA